MLSYLCKMFVEIPGKCTVCVEYYQNWWNWWSNILFLQQECLRTNELHALNSNILPTLSGILICFSVDQIFYPVSIQQPRGIMIKSFQGFTGAVRLLSRHSALFIFCRRICIAPFFVPSALCQGAVRPTFLHIHTSFLLCAHQPSLFGSLLYIQLTFTYNKIRKTTTDVLQRSLIAVIDPQLSGTERKICSAMGEKHFCNTCQSSKHDISKKILVKNINTILLSFIQQINRSKAESDWSREQTGKIVVVQL